MTDSRDTEEVNVPDIKSWDDFKQISEIHDTDEQGNSVPNRTAFVVFNEQGFCFRGDVRAPKDSITLDQARACLQLDSNESMYPNTPQDMPTTDSFPFSNETNTYIKTPNATSFNAYASVSTMSSNILREAKVLELVSKNPHPNLVDFRGAVVENQRIVGFALDKYPGGLAQYLKSGAYGAGSSDGNGKSLDSLSAESRKKICDGIEAGLDHLHSMGLAHNDVNPANVMFNESGTPVIVDLGSCRPVGEVLHERGTVGWNQGFKRTSEVENDMIGLGKIREWLGVLDGKKTERNLGMGSDAQSKSLTEEINSRNKSIQNSASYPLDDTTDEPQMASESLNEPISESAPTNYPRGPVALSSAQGNVSNAVREGFPTKTEARGTLMNYRPQKEANPAERSVTGPMTRPNIRRAEVSPNVAQPLPSVVPSKHALDEAQEPNEGAAQQSNPTTWMSYR